MATKGIEPHDVRKLNYDGLNVSPHKDSVLQLLPPKLWGQIPIEWSLMDWKIELLTYLVSRKEKYIRIIVESIISSIPVVYIKINDKHTL